MSMKTLDKDIVEVLERLEEDIELHDELNYPSDEDLLFMRQTETVIRRLAREAGYSIGERS